MGLLMEFLMCFFEFRIGYMSVDLCSRDGGMPEEFLDNANVGTIGQ